jgi:hypothetical protein
MTFWKRADFCRSSMLSDQPLPPNPTIAANGVAPQTLSKPRGSCGLAIDRRRIGIMHELWARAEHACPASACVTPHIAQKLRYSAIDGRPPGTKAKAHVAMRDRVRTTAARVEGKARQHLQWPSLSRERGMEDGVSPLAAQGADQPPARPFTCTPKFLLPRRNVLVYRWVT